MGRKLWLSIIFMMVIPGFGAPLGVQAEGDERPIMHRHEQKENDHHKEIRKKIEEFEKRGYKQENIRKAILIAKHAEVEPQEVLDTYQMTNSWQATAKSFRIDYEKIKQHHQEKGQAFFKQNKPQILKELIAYTGKDETELADYLEKEISMKTLMKAAVVAKLSETELEHIIKENQEGKSWKDIILEREIDPNALKSEMKNLFHKVKNKSD
ncbi:hypothetical protein SAMN05421743_109102 [Thalassobacillus cyri]|uniref:Uncharacterized protein n=1 Tax=Thalassobacillus cyri TaxID=571932 RepID=A0A1H4EJ62_9BACI|nr:hypothetical protein [Thalassobacillus cyri]SEA85101.1 hypothetical protein SAMN05421743_109102 [Thalassobacillus cyri]